MSFVWTRDTLAPPATDAAWQRHGGALVIALVGLLTIFHRDVAELAHVWWTSTTYGHCLFVLPVVGWLIWQRRAELVQVAPVGWWPGLVAVAAGALLWLLGDAAAVALVRQCGLLAMVWGAVAATLGLNVVRGLLFPLAWMVFLIPFGQEFEAPLQTLTADMSVALLHAVGVPAALDGVLIRTPTGFFEVAEACSGSKFLIAMLAFGTLVAHVCFRSWARRAVFMVVAIVVPILANGVRAFGTMYAAHLTSVEAATGFDHIVYGWVFFAAVMAGVLALGWRWFDRAPDDAVIDPVQLSQDWRGRAPLALGVGGTLVMGFVAFLAAGLLSSRADALPPVSRLPEVPGWTRVAPDVVAPWSPTYPTADRLLLQRYRDASGRTVDLAVAVYAGQHEGKELVAFGQGVLREGDDWIRIADLAPLAGGRAVRITAATPAGQVERTVTTTYRVGGATMASDRAAKLAGLRAKFTAAPQAAVGVHLSAVGEPAGARAAITEFAAALGPVDRLADRLTGAR